MINPMSLEGKKIIVTGAASGIGRETAVLLSRLGANLLLLDKNQDGLLETRAHIGKDVSVIPCDLTDFDGLKATIVASVAGMQGGGFHGIVHCAGIPAIIPLRALSNETYEKVQKINVEAGLNLIKIFSSRSIHNSDGVCSAVLISSVYGLVGSACNVAYAISKAAVIGMTKSLAIELAPKRIRVNCIAPGFIKTPMGDAMRGVFDEEYAKRIEAMHPLGWGEPLDIANGIAFLLSDASKWTTGAVFNIDGGFTAQ